MIEIGTPKFVAADQKLVAACVSAGGFAPHGSRAEPSRAEPSRAEPSRAEPSRRGNPS